jgi:hypothetical protein
MADLETQDAPFGLNQVTFTPGERVADRLFEGRRRSSTSSNASWHDWVSGNAEGSVSRRRPSPCDYIRSSSRPSHTHRLLRSRRLPNSRTASWVSQGTSTDSRDSWSVYA